MLYENDATILYKINNKETYILKRTLFTIVDTCCIRLTFLPYIKNKNL